MQEREFTVGWVSKSSKRSSGLFSVFKWFGNKENSTSAPGPDLVNSASSSCESVESVFSTDTVASFAFVPPCSYKPFGSALQVEKFILSGPETSTYRARLAQREVRRETDKNLTLRSKYNLFKDPLTDRGHSLPLMNKTPIKLQAEAKMHRRTVSESSKHRFNSPCHVKGKRKAPQPPGFKINENTLRRKKRIAPQPPSTSSTPDVIFNDSLKLDHGILKPAKNLSEPSTTKTVQTQEIVQVSPRPWYKRTLSKNITLEKKTEEKRKSGLSFLTNISELDREAMEIINKENLKMKYLRNSNQAPAFMRPRGSEHNRTNSDSWLSPKRKSTKDLIAKFNAITGVSKSSSKESIKEVIIPIIQEKNIKKESPRTTAVVKPISRSLWNCPKCMLENDYWRIICKVCSTIKPYFDDFTSISSAAAPLTETRPNTDIYKNDTSDLLSLNKFSDLQRSVFHSQFPKITDNIDNMTNKHNETAKQIDFKNKCSQINLNSEITPIKSLDNVENEITVNTESKKIEKIILGDELAFNDPKTGNKIKQFTPKIEKISNDKPEYINFNKFEQQNDTKVEKIILGDEISVKKQSTSSENKSPIKSPKPEEKTEDIKREEHEKLKKMLIEMKNSLPKRILKNEDCKQRISLIQEQFEPEPEEEKAEIIIATTETVYENIKIKQINAGKPLKVSSSAQTNAVLRQNDKLTVHNSKGSFQLIGANDFIGITNEKTKNVDGNHTYANLHINEPKMDIFAGYSKTDTLEINRLLRRLETAIAEGELGQAAIFARELAQLKVPLNVIRQKTEDTDKLKNNAQCFNVDMFVEDKISHRGPFPLKVTELMTVAKLKELVEEKYKIPRGVQRWILGKQLATDDNASLLSHQITSSGSPVFLYLVAPASDIKPTNTVEIIEVNDELTKKSPNPTNNAPIAVIEEADEKEKEETPEESQQVWKCQACTLLNPTVNSQCEVCGLIKDKTSKKTTYLQLINLDNEDLVRNMNTFECLICLAECPPGEGVTLRECLHQFCRTCLANTVEFSEEAEVKCPYRDEEYSCDIALQDREVKSLVSTTVYEQHLAKSVKQAENKMDNTFHCKTPDCKGWCIYEDNVNDFRCPICLKNNCLTCQVIHSGKNCKQYQELMKSQSETDEEARRTRDFLEEMISRGEALACPTCQVVLLKKWGCDWLRCSMCKTEICWVTRGPRWGPDGKGDTSAGCKCGVNGVKCHTKCNYCH